MPPTNPSSPERVAWADFGPRFDWQQGEHVSIAGPTGCGKTVLGLSILSRREWVAVFGTKPRSRTLDTLRRSGYRRIVKWPPPGPHIKRVLLWPKWSAAADIAKQQRVFVEAIDAMFASGGWCIYVDELKYVAKRLRLETHLQLLWEQGRELGLSLVGGTQRPAWVPREAWSEPTHFFCFRMTDRRDLQTIGGIGELDPATIHHFMRSLGKHDVLYLNTRTGETLVTRVE